MNRSERSVLRKYHRQLSQKMVAALRAKWTPEQASAYARKAQQASLAVRRAKARIRCENEDLFVGISKREANRLITEILGRERQRRIEIHDANTNAS